MLYWKKERREDEYNKIVHVLCDSCDPEPSQLGYVFRASGKAFGVIGNDMHNTICERTIAKVKKEVESIISQAIEQKAMKEENEMQLTNLDYTDCPAYLFQKCEIFLRNIKSVVVRLFCK